MLVFLGITFHSVCLSSSFLFAVASSFLLVVLTPFRRRTVYFATSSEMFIFWALSTLSPLLPDNTDAERKVPFFTTETCLSWLVSSLFFALFEVVDTCFSRHALLLLQPFSTVAFCCHLVTFNKAKPPPKPVSCSVNEFDVARIRPQLGVLPHFETFTLQNLTLRRLPGLTAWIIRHGGSPYLLSKHGNIKMRDYMVGWVSPPKRVTSPTWDASPPCKCTCLTFYREVRYLLCLSGCSLSRGVNIQEWNVLTVLNESQFTDK